MGWEGGGFFGLDWSLDGGGMSLAQVEEGKRAVDLWVDLTR